jgi:hypothetical protein
MRFANITKILDLSIYYTEKMKLYSTYNLSFLTFPRKDFNAMDLSAPTTLLISAITNYSNIT